ncbi:PilN domain-containing protein [Serratia sp. NPDC078593]|uniref:PilN domain-containing protein n=1 Tax=unclassified Serratia (in: enterobacteria) TaxID=2647522 RepID=UPI0037D83BE1
MHQVNFLPWREQAQRRRAAFWLRVLCGHLVLTLAILALALSGLRYQRHQLQEVLQRQAQHYGVLVRQQQQIQAAMTRIARMAARETQRQRNQKHNQRYVRLLQQLAAVLPEPLWLIALEEQAETLTLRGLSPHYPAVVQLTQRLTSQALLPGYRLSEVMQRKDDLLVFTLLVPWRRDE